MTEKENLILFAKRSAINRFIDSAYKTMMATGNITALYKIEEDDELLKLLTERIDTYKEEIENLDKQINNE